MNTARLRASRSALVQAARADVELHLRHGLGAADVVEQDGEAQHDAQAHQALAFLAELGEAIGRNVAAVAAHQQGEQLLVDA